MTTAQKETYIDMKEKLNACLKCETFEKYMNCKYLEHQNRLPSIKLLCPTLDDYIDHGDEFKDIHEKEYYLAHDKNAVWGFYNSATLRCLERQGLIKVIKDGGWNSDIVILLPERGC